MPKSVPHGVPKPLWAIIACLLCMGIHLARGEEATIAPPPQSLLTASCDPCGFEIGQKLSPYTIRFKTKSLPGGRRTIEALQVSREDRPGWIQSLAVHNMDPVEKDEEFFIGTADINFDGYNDLLLATSRGTANTYADYWLFVPSTQEFSYLGNYPIFTVESKKHLLSTNERGGYGGMIYQSSHYRFIDGVLTLVESEKQESTGKEGVYRKSLFKLQNGKLRLIKQERIKAPTPQ